jgi:hypothetical protein
MGVATSFELVLIKLGGWCFLLVGAGKSWSWRFLIDGAYKSRGWSLLLVRVEEFGELQLPSSWSL